MDFCKAHLNNAKVTAVTLVLTSRSLEEGIMARKIVMFLSIVCIFTLMFSISSTLVYGGNDSGSQNYKMAGTWVMNNSFGDVMTTVLSCKGDASCREASGSFILVTSDPKLGGLYPDAEGSNEPGFAEIHRTGHDTYEYSAMRYVRNEDGSVAYFWISKAIGRFVDENTHAASALVYFYNGENVNLLGMDPNIGPDGMPLDETDLIPLLGMAPLPDLTIFKRLNAVLPSLDPPADHFPLP
jgi:hypothetical protein